jgi:transposase
MIIKSPEKKTIAAMRSVESSYGLISKALNLKKSTVAKHCQRKAIEAYLGERPKISKAKITGRDSLAIKNYLFDHPTATLQQIIAALELDVSCATVSRFLKRNNYIRKRGKPSILLKPANKQKRLEFAQEMLRKTDEELNRIMWTDEFTVQSYPNNEIVFFWTPKSGENVREVKVPRVQNGGIRVMFWGSLSYHDFGPITHVGYKMNSQAYIELIDNLILPEWEESGRSLILQQDNAPAHVSRATLAHLETKGMEVLKWPAQSPDLSPIENYWTIIKHQLRNMSPRPRTKDAIITAVYEIWMGLCDKQRKKVVSSFRKRLVECVKKGGDLTKY